MGVGGDRERLVLRDSDDYRGKNILAPMVRVGTLPMRLLAAEYGADIVYGEELVDKRVMHCQRVENKTLNTVDFMDKNNKLVFRTCPEEHGRMVFQIGTGDAVTALKAAEVVCNDVAAIDINMGCPKHFSTSGGMGSKLLKEPEKIRDIMTSLRRNLPSTKPVTCKIRLLEKVEDTIELVRVIESCGVTAMGLHGRYVPQRPREAAHWSLIKEVVANMSIPVIANGDVFKHEDFQRIRDETGAASAMCARGAQWNCSIFSPHGLRPVPEVIREYMKKSILMDNPVQNCKYVIKEMIVVHSSLESAEGKAVQKCTSLLDLAKLYGLEDYYIEVMRDRDNQFAQRSVSKKRLAEEQDETGGDDHHQEGSGPREGGGLKHTLLPRTGSNKLLCPIERVMMHAPLASGGEAGQPTTAGAIIDITKGNAS
mmetsp:Transcript_18101/g.30439  ORF Transcript_18101/g.30439 Transcript_18101/m.30439 type:complete len:425 (+) Transcript_18101:362-1636(+)|eukprot:CAMPEP_0198200498 /NCGR_PEP_ID=MMETSP1445-20131203/3498_1 /TAXON_ID=36898 /ORGANISM="Pyramimonas sp., Strain CCMP2087" /LENGTH=424 /DNA_ID=CAMNT_0043870585 /DNA_START=286 /DNA_END=1560 /DNA_ORIENTATION=-